MPEGKQYGLLATMVKKSWDALRGDIDRLNARVKELEQENGDLRAEVDRLRERLTYSR